jgi:hypothetical protein
MSGHEAHMSDQPLSANSGPEQVQQTEQPYSISSSARGLFGAEHLPGSRYVGGKEGALFNPS